MPPNVSLTLNETRAGELFRIIKATRTRPISLLKSESVQISSGNVQDITFVQAYPLQLAS
jgi:hypothetical protein